MSIKYLSVCVSVCSQYNMLNLPRQQTFTLPNYVAERPVFRALQVLLLLVVVVLLLWKMNTYNEECSPNKLIQVKFRSDLKVYKS